MSLATHQHADRETGRPAVVATAVPTPDAPGAAQGLRLVEPPPLRVRPLPQPQPQPWSPPAGRGPVGTGTTARHGGLGPGPEQGTFVLHAVPRMLDAPSLADPVPTPVEQLPCPEQLARRLVQAAVDVVRGHRPATQVLRWTTPEVYSQLRQRARLEQAGGTPTGRRPVVRSLRTHPVGTTAVEVSAVVLDGPRARAVAARLDGEDSRWRLTALVIG